MNELADGSVHCVVTSPPYWGLRKYAGVPDLVFDDGWTGQLGQEPTPELYIKHIVDIFREVKRVLRSDGVCFINIGDSYISNPGDRAKVGGFQANPSQSRLEAESAMSMNKHKSGYKPQDKCLIPFRLAIALQEDAWWIRQDIIWQKNNSMPESVNSPRWVKHKIKVKAGTKGAMGDP